MSNLTILKAADVDYLLACANDTIGYTIQLTNTGTTCLSCIQVADVFQQQVSLVPGSVRVDGYCYDVCDLSSGIRIKSLAPGQTKIISFKVAVYNAGNLTEIDNQATAYYYDTNSQLVTVTSNVVTVPVIDVDAEVTKVASGKVVSVGDTFSYEITITNTGSTPMLNPSLTDNLPNCLQLVSGSITINGEASTATSLQNLDLGDQIDVGDQVDVDFNVTVANYPRHGCVKNMAIVDYEYSFVAGGTTYQSTASAWSEFNKVRVTRDGDCGCC